MASYLTAVVPTSRANAGLRLLPDPLLRFLAPKTFESVENQANVKS
jgi:hypothetical protein